MSLRRSVRNFRKTNHFDLNSIDFFPTNSNLFNKTHPPIVFIVGGAGSGKTSLIQTILSHNPAETASKAIVISANEPTKHEYSAANNCHAKYDPLIIETALINSSLLKKEKPCEHSCSFIVLDDCLSKWPSRDKDKIFSLLIHTTRFSLFSVLIATSSCSFSIPNNMKLCAVNLWFFLHEPSATKRRQIYDNFNFDSSVPTFDLFCDLMDTLFDYECLVINLTYKHESELYTEKSWSDKVFWFRTQPSSPLPN